MSYVGLESVGSIVTTNGIIFPTDISEAPETASDAEIMSGVHLYDAEDEWFISLSSDDLTELFNFLQENMDVVEVVFNEWRTNIWSMWEEANNCYMNLEVI